MISLQAYRSRIGCYVSTARRITAQNRYFRVYNKRVIQKNSSKKKSRGQGRNFSIFAQFFKLSRVFRILCVIIIVGISVYSNYQQLIVDGDVESNPGPFNASKVVRGTFNQGNIQRYGDTAGIQCACNSLIAICWGTIKRVSIWKSWDLDNIIDLGDALFKKLGMNRSI